MGQNAQSRRRRMSCGANIVELGILLFLLALIAGVVGFTVFPKLNAARRERAALDLQSLERALWIFGSRKGCYPDEATGIRALVEAGVLEAMPLDPWRNDYVYRVREGAPVILSYGGDGEPGGEDLDADILVPLHPLPPNAPFGLGPPSICPPVSRESAPPSLPAPNP
ncbi:type II secretion system protein GspG [Pyxidicoccus sp. 3LFB2]